MRSLGEVLKQADGSLKIDPDVGSDIDGLGGSCTTRRKTGRLR
jgi:hypothetical protein